VVPAINPGINIVGVNGRFVCALEVPKGLHKPYQSLDGKFWVRVGSTNRQATKEELSRLFQSAGLVHFDIAPVEGTSVSDLDLQKAHLYWHRYYDVDFVNLDQEEQANILINSDLLVQHEENMVASVGGLLLFGKQPQRRLPQSSILFAVFKGGDLTAELIDEKEITGTLPELIDNTAALIRLFLPNPSIIVGLKREEHDLVPQKVIREALVNAVCHRDYSIANRKITAYLFDDRLEITSPGKIANTLTLQKIRYGNSASRNMFIVKYLDNMRYIDGLGRGVPMMLKAMKEDVDFKEIGELFRVTFRIGPPVERERQAEIPGADTAS
jgi:ATP-dependent DNA helicase RecG